MFVLQKRFPMTRYFLFTDCANLSTEYESKIAFDTLKELQNYLHTVAFYQNQRKNERSHAVIEVTKKLEFNKMTRLEDFSDKWMCCNLAVYVSDKEEVKLNLEDVKVLKN